MDEEPIKMRVTTIVSTVNIGHNNTKCVSDSGK